MNDSIGSAGHTDQGRKVADHWSRLAVTFDSDSFDVVIMQHVAMQISEKDSLFDELARVGKPGGRLALHEIFSGEGE